MFWTASGLFPAAALGAAAVVFKAATKALLLGALAAAVALDPANRPARPDWKEAGKDGPGWSNCGGSAGGGCPLCNWLDGIATVMGRNASALGAPMPLSIAAARPTRGLLA